MSFEKKSYDELVTEIKINLVNNVDEINDLNVGSVLDNIVSVFGNSLEGLYEDLQTVYEGTRITTATGEDLDELGLIVGVSRDPGRKSEGIVTFEVLTPLSIDNVISEGVQVSTQPNTTEPQYIFEVEEDTVFRAQVLDEEINFITGTYTYKLGERFISEVSQVKDDVPTIFVEGDDYVILNEGDADYDSLIIDTTTNIIFNDCTDDDYGNWSYAEAADGPIVEDSNEFYQGGTSFRLAKDDSDEISEFVFERPSSISVVGKSLILNLFIKDLTIKDLINNVNFSFSNSSGFTAHFKKTFTRNDLSIGWNTLVLTPGETGSETVGNVDTGNIKYFKLIIETNNSADVFSDGDINLDNIRFANIREDYNGTIIKILRSGNINADNLLLVNYKPISCEVPCEAVRVGTEFNVISNQIVHKVSSLPQIRNVNNYESFTGGLNVETDDSLRDRIIFASELANVATVEAIRNNVLALPYVSTCSVIDMPLKSIIAEKKTFDDTVFRYRLDYLNPTGDNIFIGRATTTLSGDIDFDTSPILVDDTTDFPASGMIKIGDELISYSSKSDSPHSFTISERGAEGTVATSHYEDDTVLLNENDTLDYSYDPDNFEIVFDNNGTVPSNDEDFYVDYDYSIIGFFEVFVTGPDGELTLTQLTEIDEVVDSIRSAGIQYTIEEPSYPEIDFNIEYDLKSGFFASSVNSNIRSTVSDYVLSLDLGEDVIYNKVIKHVMSIDGVSDVVSLTLSKDGAAGVSVNIEITDQEKAIPRTFDFTVNE